MRHAQSPTPEKVNKRGHEGTNMGVFDKFMFRPERLNREAMKAAERGDYSTALDLVDQALCERAGNPVFLQNKGYFLAKLGQYDEAIECYELAYGYDKKNHELLAMKGSLLVRKGRYDEARDAFETAMAKAAHNERIMSQSAIGFYDMGDKERAKEVLETIMHSPIMGNYAETWVYRSNIAYDEGDLTEAHAFAEIALDIDGANDAARAMIEKVKRDERTTDT
ncbi:MAG TPA: tetratricopeptide repeat protein [Methanomicrobia archaeon]|nr:tetratricopeptide repeat protein [Methanomicrobia archaeon]